MTNDAEFTANHYYTHWIKANPENIDVSAYVFVIRTEQTAVCVVRHENTGFISWHPL